MAIKISRNEKRVYDYLKSISLRCATNDDIRAAAEVEPHQQVFQITQKLMSKGLIRIEQEIEARRGNA